MRNFEAVINELKDGSELIIVSRDYNGKRYCNAYISNDGKNYEEIRVLKYMQYKVHILQEIDENNIFRLCFNKETGNYESAILNKTQLEENMCVYDVADGKYAEDEYLFNSIEKLEMELKLARRKELLKEKNYNNYGKYKLNFNDIKKVS